MTPIVTTTRYKCSPRGPLLRMISLIVLATMAPAAADDVPELQYGTYVCVTDRAVGFQTSTSNDKERFSGNIHFPPEYQKFFVTLHKIAQGDNFVANGWLTHPPELCFSDQMIKGLQHQWENNGRYTGEPYPFVRHFQQQCLATSEAQVKTGETIRSYYGIGNNVFTDSLANRFWITSKSFVWDYTNDDNDYYMLEGRCELVK